MKKQLRSVTLVAALLTASCSLSSKQRAESSVRYVTGSKNPEVIYRVIFNRETFIPPCKDTDYSIDSAMRMGTFPRVNEPDGMPQDMFFLEGGMNKVLGDIEKKSPAAANKLVLKLTNEIGLTWGLLEHSAKLGPVAQQIVQNALQNPACKKSTYCQLALIKQSRIKSGSWHP